MSSLKELRTCFIMSKVHFQITGVLDKPWLNCTLWGRRGFEQQLCSFVGLAPQFMKEKIKIGAWNCGAQNRSREQPICKIPHFRWASMSNIMPKNFEKIGPRTP